MTLKELGGQLAYTDLSKMKRTSASVKRKQYRKSQSVDDCDDDALDAGTDKLPSLPSTEDLMQEEPAALSVPVEKRISSKRRDRYLQVKKKKDPMADLTKTQGRSFSHMIESVPDYAQYTHGANIVNVMSAQSKGRRCDAAQVTYSSDGSLKGYEVSIDPYRQSKVQLEQAIAKRGVYWNEMSEVKGSGLLGDLDVHQKKLQEALFEIIMSELAYMKSLEYLVETAMPDMETKFDLEKGKREHTHLFSNIVNVYRVSAKLCKIWEELWCTNVLLNATEVCDTMTEFFSTKEHRMTYILYYKNVIYQQRMSSQLSNENEHFKSYTRDLGHNRLSLYDGFLALPFQRIPRYRILVEAVIKSLPGEDVSGPEYHAVQACVDVILTFVAQCNNAVKKMEDLENMIALDKRLDFAHFKKVPVISEHREFIKRGFLRRLVPGLGFLQKAMSGASQSWEIHMFSDLVIMAQAKKNDVLLVKCYCKPSQVYAENVSKAKAEELIECSLPSGCNFLLKVRFFPTGDDASGIGRDWFVLSCPTSESQLRWSEALSPEMPDKEIDYDKITKYSRAECPVVQVIHSYRAQHGDELTIYEGEVLKIHRKMTDCDWCEGEKLSSGEKGWFPAKFTEEIKNPSDRQSILQKQNKVMQMTMRFNETNPCLKEKLHSLKELQQLEIYI